MLTRTVKNTLGDPSPCGMGLRCIDPIVKVIENGNGVQSRYKISALNLNQGDQSPLVFPDQHPGITGIPVACSGFSRIFQNFSQKPVPGPGFNKKCWHTNGRAKKYLAALAFHSWGIRYHGMVHLPGIDILLDQGRDQHLQVSSFSHIPDNIFKHAEVTVFKPGIPHLVIFPQTDQLVQGHAPVKHTHFGQVFFKVGFAF